MSQPLHSPSIKLFFSLIACALLFAVPASFQVDSSFKPVKRQTNLNGAGSIRFKIDLPRTETLRAVAGFHIPGSISSIEWLRLGINGQEIRRFRVKLHSLWQEYELLIPGKFVTPGENEISVELVPATSELLEIQVKLYNYHGGSPNIPVAYVIYDSEASPEAINKGNLSNFAVTFLLALCAFSLCILVLRVEGYNSFGDTLAALPGNFGLIVSLPWVSLAYGLLTSHEIVFPVLTVFWIIIITFATLQLIGICVVGPVQPAVVGFILPRHPKGKLFPRSTVQKIHQAISQSITQKYDSLPVRLLLILLFLIPTLIYGYFIIFKTINIPNSDDYALVSFLNRFDQLSNLGDRVALLFSQHNEHRIAFSRAVFLLTYYLYELDFRILIVLGNTALVLLALLFFRTLPTEQNKLFFFLPIPPLLFSLSNHINLVWAIGSITNFYVLCFAGLSLYFLTRPDSHNLFLALIFAVLCTFTSGGGMLVFFSGAACLLVKRDVGRNLIWISIGGVCIFYYFHNFTHPGIHPGLIQTTTTPLNFALFFLGFLGSAAAFGNSSLAILAGLSGIFYFSYLTIKKFYSTNPFIYFFMTYLILVAGAAAIGRSDFGVEAAIVSRYLINSTLFLILIYLSWLDTFCSKNFKLKVVAVSYLIFFTLYNSFWAVKEHTPAIQNSTINFADKMRQNIHLSGNEIQLKSGLAVTSLSRLLEKGKYRLPCEKIFHTRLNNIRCK